MLLGYGVHSQIPSHYPPKNFKHSTIAQEERKPMQTDHNGIVFYEPSDPAQPLHTTLNAGQTSVSQALDALEARVQEQTNFGKRYGVNNQTFPTNEVTRYEGFGPAGDDDFFGRVEPIGNYGIRVLDEGWYRLDGSIRFSLGGSSSGVTAQTRLYSSNHGGINVGINTRDTGNVVIPTTATTFLEANEVVWLSAWVSASRETNLWGSFPETTSLAVHRL